MSLQNEGYREICHLRNKGDVLNLLVHCILRNIHSDSYVKRESSTCITRTRQPPERKAKNVLTLTPLPRPPGDQHCSGESWCTPLSSSSPC